MLLQHTSLLPSKLKQRNFRKISHLELFGFNKNIIEDDLSYNEPEYLINDEPTDECTEKQQEIVLSQLPNYIKNDIFEIKKDQNHLVYEFDFKRLNQINNLENFPNFPEFHISREFIDEYRQRKLKNEFNHLRLKE